MADRDKVTLADIQGSMSPAVKAQIEREMGKASASLPSPSRRGKGKSITAADIEAMPASTREAVINQLKSQGGGVSPQIQKILNLAKNSEQENRQSIKDSAEAAKKNEQQLATINASLEKMIAAQTKTVGLLRELLETVKTNNEEEEKKSVRSRKLMNVIIGALMLLGGGGFVAAGLVRMLGDGDAIPTGRENEDVGRELAPGVENERNPMPTTPGESIVISPEELEQETLPNTQTNSTTAPATQNVIVQQAVPNVPVPTGATNSATVAPALPTQTGAIRESTGSISPAMPAGSGESLITPLSSAAEPDNQDAIPIEDDESATVSGLATRVSAPDVSSMAERDQYDDTQDAVADYGDQDAVVEGDYNTTADRVKSELPSSMRDVTFKANEIRFKANEFKFETDDMLSGGAPGAAPGQMSGMSGMATPTAFRTAAPPPTTTGGGGGELLRPISTPITSGFGQRALGNHEGLDFGAPEGTPVVSSHAGTVIRADTSSSYGNVVYVRGDDGTETRYAHLSTIGVQQGQRVEQGQPVGLSGNTGRSFGPHLHYEVIKDGQKVDPAPLIGGSQEARESTAGAAAGELSETEAPASRTTGAGAEASATPVPPATPGGTLASASQARSLSNDMPAATSAEPAPVNTPPESSSTPTSFGAPSAGIDPNEPGPVEPPDAVDRYRRLFNMDMAA